MVRRIALSAVLVLVVSACSSDSVSDKLDETISVLEPGTPGTGGWTDEQLTETGEYIRGVFRSYCE